MSNPTGKGGLQERKHHINRKGRPKSFDALRKLAQQIAHEEVTDKKGETLTVIEVIMRQWAKDPKLQAKFIEYAFGKVPDAVEVSGKDGGTINVKLVKHDD